MCEELFYLSVFSSCVTEIPCSVKVKDREKTVKLIFFKLMG